MTKKEIKKVLKAIRRHCNKTESCEGCVFRPLCCYTQDMKNAEIDVMANELKKKR